MPKDWTNIDLDSYEVEASLIDSLSFEELLLTIRCNLPRISEQTVRKLFLEELQRITDDAKQVFEANVTNIVTHALHGKD